MKKVIMTLLMIAVCSVNSFAQKGMNGIGVTIPTAIGQGTTSVGIGLDYYHNFSSYFRIGVLAEYAKTVGKESTEEYDYPMFKGFVNGNIFLASPRPVRPYFVAGLGYVYYDQNVNKPETISAVNSTGKVVSSYYYDKYLGYSDDGFNYNVGLGCDFRLSHSFSMQLEATGMSCLIGSNNSNDDTICHQGKWTFIGRLCFTYNF